MKSPLMSLDQARMLVSHDLDLVGNCLILDTSSEAALDVIIRNQNQIDIPKFDHMCLGVMVTALCRFLLILYQFWAGPLSMSENVRHGTPKSDHPLLAHAPGVKHLHASQALTPNTPAQAPLADYY